MSQRPYFKFYPGDWLSAPEITLMTPAEEGAYIRLLAYCWKDPDCSLPDDDDALVTLSRMANTCDCHCGSMATVKRLFMAHPSLPQRLTHPRLLREWHELEEWKAKRSAAGKRGAESRWKNAMAIVLPMANDMAKHATSPSPSPSPSKDCTGDPSTTESRLPRAIPCPNCQEPLLRQRARKTKHYFYAHGRMGGNLGCQTTVDSETYLEAERIKVQRKDERPLMAPYPPEFPPE